MLSIGFKVRLVEPSRTTGTPDRFTGYLPRHQGRGFDVNLRLVASQASTLSEVAGLSLCVLGRDPTGEVPNARQ